MTIIKWWRSLWAKPASPAIAAPVDKNARLRGLERLVELSAAKRTKSGFAKPVVYKMPSPPPGVVPSGVATMANDSALGSLYTYAASYGSGYYGNSTGIGFLGYPFLSELAQRAEFRKMAETLAREMTRKWIEIRAKGDGEKDDKVAKIEARFKELGVQALFQRAGELDAYFGVGHIYIDTGETEKPDELKLPLFIDKSKIKKGSLKAFRIVEPLWTYPNDYNSNNPLRPDFMRPKTWFVQGTMLHRTRLLTFISRPVPDLLKPAYAFGGVSLTQLAVEYVDNWLRTRQSVSDLTHNFSIMQLATNLSSALNGGAGAELDLRAQVFNNYRDNQSLMLTDKDSEAMANVSAPLGTLDHLQAQAQEQMASVSSIPLVKLLGITPSGLNASSDGEIRVFYDTVSSLQQMLFAPNLDIVLQIVQLDLFGEIDPDISYTFVPLWQLDEAGQAAVRKTDADTDAVLIDAGVLSPEESRKRVANDLEGPYSGLDVSDMPEPPKDPAAVGLNDPSEQIDKAGAEGNESGANSGV